MTCSRSTNDATTEGRLRVAVLGGGMGALAAAVALTDPRSPHASRLSLTLYQIGWRLGGKGASGRSLDPATYGRIEEHGLHNLFGFYDHTFRLMRGVYDELRLRHGIDRGDFMDAVAPESAAVFVEQIDGEARPWHIHNPTNARVPGDDGELSLAEAVRLALDFLRLNAANHSRPLAAAPPGPAAESRATRAALRAVTAGLTALLRLVPAELRERPWWEQLAWLADRVHPALVVGALELARRGAHFALRRSFAADGPRRLWILIHFATAVMIGLCSDRAFARGLESLNHLDFRAWLRPHMMDDGGLLDRSVLLRVVYDSSFAYRGGDTRASVDGAPQADYEAGTLLAGLLRAAFTYKGAFGWKLRGGTGDVLIAPIYALLRARGVEFRFFHRVDALLPSEDGRFIDRVALTRQARTLDGGEYAPLVDFDGAGCWPNRPRWELLADGADLAEARLDLEDPRVTPPGALASTLTRGVDFDAVILGISAGALPMVASRLIAQNQRWRTATERVATTRTQSLQVWLRSGAAAPGHGHGAGQPITGFWYDAASPLNVWADMSHLIAREGWQGGEVPGHLSYYVSPLGDAPADDHAALAAVRANAVQVLAGPGAAQLRPADAPPLPAFCRAGTSRPERGALRLARPARSAPARPLRPRAPRRPVSARQHPPLRAVCAVGRRLDRASPIAARPGQLLQPLSRRRLDIQRHELRGDGVGGARRAAGREGAHAVTGGRQRELAMLVATPWTSLDDLLAGLRAIDDWGRRRGDVRGSFAAAYVVVTAAVAEALRRGAFAEPEWVVRVVLDFADRYRLAVRAAMDGAPGRPCWGPALRPARGGAVAAIVALLHAMIAHIHHDLAHTLSANAPIHARRAADYEHLGAVICGATRTIQRELLTAYAPGLRGVHEALRGADTWLTNTLVRAWRARARQIAVRMSASPAGAATWSRRLARESAALAAGLDALTWRLHERAAAGVESAAFGTLGSGQ